MSVTLTAYLDCDNHDEPLEALFRRLLYVDTDGHLYLNVTNTGHVLAHNADSDPEP